MNLYRAYLYGAFKSSNTVGAYSYGSFLNFILNRFLVKFNVNYYRL